MHTDINLWASGYTFMLCPVACMLPKVDFTWSGLLVDME